MKMLAAPVFLVLLQGIAGAQVIQTAPPNNGRSDNGAGAFFDLTATNALSITSFEYYASSGAGTPTTLQVWIIPGTYVPHNGTSTGWVLHDTVQAVSAGTTAPAPVVLNTPLAINAGQTVGIYLVTLNGGIRYNGTSAAPPQTLYSNADLSLYGEHTRGGPPWTGPLFTPRTFSGAVHYTAGPTGCYPNCDESTTEPVLNVADFSCFLQKFAAAEPYANCDESTTEPVLNVADFSCFLQRFAGGCR